MPSVSPLLKPICFAVFLALLSCTAQAATAPEQALTRVEQEQEFLKQKLQKYEKVIEIMDKKMSESSVIKPSFESSKLQEIKVVPRDGWLLNGEMVVVILFLLIAILTAVRLALIQRMKTKKKKKSDTQKERLSKFAWMIDTGPEFRFFFKEMESFFARGKELRVKRSQFGEKERESFRTYVLGRWILGESTFEEDDRIAEEAVKHVIATFPTKQNHATNRMLLKEAAIMVLRGQRI